MLKTLVGRSVPILFISVGVSVRSRFQLFWQSTHIVVRREGFVSSCNKESHGSGAGVLLGWYTEELGLKLRKSAELNEVSSIARRSLINSVV